MPNINESLNTGADGSETLVADVLDELNQITFRDFQGALKRWHEGSLSLVHLNVLMALRAHGSLTMSQLADLLDVSVASTTGIVDRMEKKGVVERRHSEADRRVVEVHVTDQGEAVSQAMRTERQVRLSALLAEIDDADLAALLRGLRAFRAARERILGNLPDAPRNRP
jgi:DNA-binding MarR family transcriptional regulator